MIITISGESCTGTTTLTKNLAAALQYPYFLVGEFSRQIAKEHHLDLMTMIGDKSYEINLDQILDEKIKQLLKSPTPIIVEGRMSGYFAWKNQIVSKRILLVASNETKAKRLRQREHDNYEYALNKIMERDQKDWQRYEHLYGITAANQKEWYSLIIETDDKSIEEVLAIAKKHSIDN